MLFKTSERWCTDGVAKGAYFAIASGLTRNWNYFRSANIITNNGKTSDINHAYF
jgi:hypothetical protein